MRYDLMNKIGDDNDITFYDPRSIDWNKFTFPNGYYKHILTSVDILKPYMISYKYFKTIAYEDFILLSNHIGNIFDLRAGIEIKIPKIEDIRTFLLENKK